MLQKLLSILTNPGLARLHARLRLRQRTNRQQALQEVELRAMSDLALTDLGIGRGEIPALLGTRAPHQDDDSWGNRHPT